MESAYRLIPASGNPPIAFELASLLNTSEWAVWTHPRRCRALRRRSPHHPVRRPSSSCTAKQAFVEVATSRAGKLLEGQLEDGGEGGQGLGKVLEVLSETPVSPEPGEGALDHPAARQDDSSLRLTIATCSSGALHRSVHLPRAVAAVRPDEFELREALWILSQLTNIRAIR